MSRFYTKMAQKSPFLVNFTSFKSRHLNHKKTQNLLFCVFLYVEFLNTGLEGRQGKFLFCRRSAVSTDDLTALGLGCQPCAAPKRQVPSPQPQKKEGFSPSFFCALNWI